jgi:hypothetical protein
MFSVALKCGNCRNLVDFIFDYVSDHSLRTPEQIKALVETGGQRRSSISMTVLKDKDVVNGSAHSHCPRCAHPALIVYECERITHQGITQIIKAGDGFIMGGSASVSVTSYYPTPATAEQNPLWPESLRRIFADAQDMLSEGKSPAIILATARSVLELALKELDSDPKPTLYQRIERLHQTGVITSPVKDWAHDIRLEGNAGTHSGKGDEAAAAEYVDFLKLFLDMTFVLPERIKEKRTAASA